MRWVPSVSCTVLHAGSLSLMDIGPRVLGHLPYIPKEEERRRRERGGKERGKRKN